MLVVLLRAAKARGDCFGDAGDLQRPYHVDRDRIVTAVTQQVRSQACDVRVGVNFCNVLEVGDGANIHVVRQIFCGFGTNGTSHSVLLLKFWRPISEAGDCVLRIGWLRSGILCKGSRLWVGGELEDRGTSRLELDFILIITSG